MLASRRGYDDPATQYPARETWKGISIIRVPSLGLGKRSKWRRILDFASYWVSCVFRLALLPRFDVVVALTSPPLISFLGAIFARMKSAPLRFLGDGPQSGRSHRRRLAAPSTHRQDA